MTGALDRIAAGRLVPVLRTTDADAAHALAERVLAAGVSVVEITTTIPSWASLVSALRAAHPDVCVGVGTVTEPGLATAAVAAGAQFCVSPYLVPSVRAALNGTGVPLVEGGFTPTEVLGAARHGMAKLFPAHIGGLGYLRSLLAVAPTARIVPTGGIALGDVRSWLAAGAAAVGVGGNLATAPDLDAAVAEILR